MLLPERTETHRTETKAVRHIISTISSNWLIRSLDERDYGIDLMFEIFGDRYPTGRIAFVQSKGTKKNFSYNKRGEAILNEFPVKTIAYALRLIDPLFVFYTSLADSKTMFIWLQHYTDTKLADTTPKWVEQETVTLYFPECNNLSEYNRIEDILHQGLYCPNIPSNSKLSL